MTLLHGLGSNGRRTKFYASPLIRTMSSSFTIVPVRTEKDLKASVELIQAYTAWLNIDLAFQDFAAEMASMPGKYAPPLGELLLARNAVGEPIGCVALRPLWLEGCCEMKRLFVPPSGRGTGVGSALVATIIQIAEKIGYREMRLDTLAHMDAARRMYGRSGFEEIEPYYENPLKGAVYLCKSLGSG